jgi:hypothetical protein
MSLLEKWMPDYDVAARYTTTIQAPAPLVYDVLLQTDFSRLPLVRGLMLLRSNPALVVSPRQTWRRIRANAAQPALRLKTVLNHEFALLDEREGNEIVIGLTGRFWTPTGGLIPTEPATFHEFPPPGMARAAWNFGVTARPDSSSELSTETRVRCSDPATTRTFLRYWRLVSPGSGIIRWAILRRIRLEAERQGRG